MNNTIFLVFQVSQSLFEKLEEFTCTLYGSKSLKIFNELRYALFCAKRGKIESHQMPPCRDCLQKHTLRANYQTFIWRSCFLRHPGIPEPEEYGWKSEEESLVIDWMSGSPAPDAVLSLLSCDCSRFCTTVDCVCIANGLRCTDMCKIKNCDNVAVEDSLSENDLSEDSEYEDYE